MNFKITHTVFKNEDIENILSKKEKEQLRMIKGKIEAVRAIRGKKINSYIVCNTDEPYAEKVLAIIRDGEAGKHLTVMKCDNCANRAGCENVGEKVEPTANDCGNIGGMPVGYGYNHEEADN